MRLLFFVLSFILVFAAISSAKGADTNTVSSTVVTDKSVPTANSPSVVVTTLTFVKQRRRVRCKPRFSELVAELR